MITWRGNRKTKGEGRETVSTGKEKEGGIKRVKGLVSGT